MMKRLLMIIALCIGMMTEAMAQKDLPFRIHFQRDSINVSEPQEAVLDMIAEYMKNRPGKTFIIAGYTSENTPESRRDALCEDRAMAVKKFLMERLHVNGEQLIAMGNGVTKRYNDSDDNEYVAFYLLEKKE